jgi:hypothetical protein
MLQCQIPASFLATASPVVLGRRQAAVALALLVPMPVWVPAQVRLRVLVRVRVLVPAPVLELRVEMAAEGWTVTSPCLLCRLRRRRTRCNLRNRRSVMQRVRVEWSVLFLLSPQSPEWWALVRL